MLNLIKLTAHLAEEGPLYSVGTQQQLSSIKMRPYFGCFWIAMGKDSSLVFPEFEVSVLHEHVAYFWHLAFLVTAYHTRGFFSDQPV